MMEESSQCPVCQESIPLSSLLRHVNEHLDDDEFAQDQALAYQLASTSETFPPLQATVDLERQINTEHASTDIMKEMAMQDNTQELVDVKRAVLLSSQVKAKSIIIEKGIMNLLRDCLESEQQADMMSCSVITGHVDHYQSFASEDLGWGCGWRNIQMFCSHLLAQNWGAKEALFGGANIVPNISSLQRWLEIAWMQGYDKAGAECFNWKIHGSKKWIGTTECAALLRSFGLRARIDDFSEAVGKAKSNGQISIKRWLHQDLAIDGQADHRKQLVDIPVNTSSIHHSVQCDICEAFPIRGVRFQSKVKSNYDLCSRCFESCGESIEMYEVIESPDSGKRKMVLCNDMNHRSLMDWVWSYFTEGRKDLSPKASIEQMRGHVFTSERTPLYFQHQGHSRTIVGMQRRKKPGNSVEETFLLVLDPAMCTNDLVKSLISKRQWQKLIKRGVHTLKKREYQVCYVEPGIAKGEELEQLKLLDSELHSY